MQKVIYGTTYVRPWRITFVIDKNATYETINYILAKSCNIWGGFYSIIVPTDGENIDQRFIRILKDFDPDMLKITFKPNEKLKNKLVNNCNPMKYNDEPGLYVSDYMHTSIENIIKKANIDTIIDFKFEIKNVKDFDKSFLYSITGKFDREKISNFKENGIKIKEVILKLYYDILENILPFGKFKENEYTPRSISERYLNFFSDVKHSYVNSKLIIICGDSIQDFCYYYSLSKLKAHIYWLPDFITKNKLLQNYVRKLREYLDKKDIHNIQMTSFNKINNELIEISNLFEKSINQISNDLRNPFTCKVNKKMPTYTLIRYERNNYKDFYLILDNNKSIGKLETPFPKHLKPEKDEIRWLTEIFIRKYLLPAKECFNSNNLIFERERLLDKTDYRVSKSGIVFNSTDPFFAGGWDTEQILRKPYIHIKTPFEIFKQFYDSYGSSIKLSDKGIYFTETIELFQDYDQFFSFFEDKTNQNYLKEFVDVAELEDKLKDLKGNNQKDLDRIIVDKRVLFTSSYLETFFDEKELNSKTDYLLSKKIIKRVLVLKCSTCRDTSIYYLDEVSDTFTCKRCKKTQNILSMNCFNDLEPNWYYKLNEIVYQGYKHNMIVPILTLNKLRKKSKKSFLFISELEIYDDENKLQLKAYKDKCEFDIHCILDGKIIIGECKSNDKLSKEDIKKYKLLAKNSNIDRLIFSTSEGNWKEGTLEKLNKLEEELGNYNVELSIYTKKDLFEND